MKKFFIAGITFVASIVIGIVVVFVWVMVLGARTG